MKTGNSTLDGQNVYDQDVIWNTLPIACTIFAFYLVHLLSDNCLVKNALVFSNYLLKLYVYFGIACIMFLSA